nr:hypothetical protein BaRGS_013265 [Batillaria attramentaria]
MTGFKLLFSFLKGQIAVGGRCYLLIQPDHIMSWGHAFETCLVRGAHLVSLNTPQEWHDVTSVLEAGRMSRDLYVGLKTAGPTLPRMYRDFWEQCVDGTDEADCSQVMYQILLSPPPPAMVDLDGKGNYDAELENVDVDSFDTFPALEVGCTCHGLAFTCVRPIQMDLYPDLRYLDAGGTRMTIGDVANSTFLIHLSLSSSLSNVYAANHKLCCPDTLPSNSYSVTCEAPSDEFSSCDALLRSNAYRVSLYVFAIMAILGNLACIVYRVCVHKNTSSCGFNVMVTHLHGSDFLMGVYLVIIGVADRMYQGVYVWHDLEWRFSAACKAAGFLSLLSSELSAFLICLVTLDRFVVLRFPFSQFRFGRMSSHIACLVAWLVALTLAGVPLAMHDWDFYDQNSICIPLPVTRKRFPGRAYAFNVMIVLNFALFLLIAVGQAFIFYAIRSNRMVGSTPNRKSQDLTIARRLIAVVVSDFLCWFPVGLLGLMSSSGMPFPSEVNVGIATFALPFNSAINPFLYTLNIILEKRARARNKQLSSSATASPRGNSTTL